MAKQEAEAKESRAAEPEVIEWSDPGVDQRLWIKTIIPMIQIRSHDTDPSPRVQLAIDKMFIAACERAARIFNSDMEPIE